MNGCDYTIGCGNKLFPIPVKSLDEGKLYLEQEILQYYPPDSENEISHARIFEVSDETEIDVPSLYKIGEQIRKENQEKERLDKERKQYELLKAKFEK